MRSRPGALTALLALAAAGTVAAAVLSVGGDESTLVSERTVTVTRGVIETVVSGSGNLEPARQVDVDFATSGRITKVYAEVGDHVSKGELLARLDDRSAEVAVAKAHAALVDAEDALNTAQTATVASTATATVTTIAVAAQATPAPTTPPAATATPRGEATPTVTATPAGGESPPDGNSPSDDRSSDGGSSDNGSSSSGGSPTQSVESAQAAVDSALLALDEAEDALDATLLRAPMAGTVVSVSAGVGDTPEAATAFIVLAQLSKLKLEVGLSESDIGKVKVGQAATVTVNAASGEDVGGHVTSVGVLASDSSSSGETGSGGAVSYPVVVTLDQSTDGLKAGMSATADIVVSRVTGLAVPSQALRGSTVTVERDGSRSTERVTTGVVGDSATQVLSGLDEGDKVIVESTSALQGLGAGTGQQQQRTGFGGGGLGGGGGGGFRPGGGAGPPVVVGPGGPGG